RAISKRFGTDHHEVMIGREEMQKFLPELVFHQDEPIADPVCVPLYYVSKLARDTGTIVVQVGEGSDELFGGYDWFRTYLQIEDRFWRTASRAPRAARRVAAAARMTYLELKLRLPELLLMRVDKITMATSVEARVPFLDHHLIEYAMNLPRDLKVKGRTGKHILKRALESVLPPDVLYQPKRGFGAPV